MLVLAFYFGGIAHKRTHVATTQAHRDNDDIYICQSVHKNNGKREQFYYITCRPAATLVHRTAIKHSRTQILVE